MTATVVCQVCKAEAPYRGPGQLYCVPCSVLQDRERGRRWIKKNPTPNDVARERSRSRAASIRLVGAEREGDASVTWNPNEIGTDLSWLIRVSVPFTYSLSKNAVWSMGGTHVYSRKKATRARQVVRDRVAEAIRSGGIVPVQSKVFVDIFVQKPDHKGDAINVIDSVCDGVKDAIGIDDRWFSLRGLDWEIVKHGSPRLIIGVGQESEENQQVCSMCGRIQLLEMFPRNRVAPMGRTRDCRECQSAAKSARRAAREAAK